MFWLNRLRRLFTVTGREALILWYAFRNPATPRAIKAASVFLLLYLVSPVDLVPDFVMLFGWADDLALLMMGIPFLVRKLPAGVLAQAAEMADRRLGRHPARAPSRD